MFGLPRSPLVLALVLLLGVLAGLDHLLVRSPPVPTEYAGSWISGPTRLDIREDGVVQYRTGDGVVFTSIGGRLTRIDRGSLTYRVLLVPRRLRIDQPPHLVGDQWLMTVEGQALWRIP